MINIDKNNLDNCKIDGSTQDVIFEILYVLSCLYVKMGEGAYRDTFGQFLKEEWENLGGVLDDKR